MDMKEVNKAMRVINSAQEALWAIHHKIKELDEPLGMKVLEHTLQIELALKNLNFELNGVNEYLK